MLPGDLYLALFPFGDRAEMKVRPVLRLTAPIGPASEIIVAYISSVVPDALLDSDLLIDPAGPGFPETRLKTASVLRLLKVATIHARSLRRRLGNIDSSMHDTIQHKLHALLNL